ncbi:DUF1643 domain-containing protein [Roseococcus sp. SDR]|uniref:DUF1643 domain-containing protein n=1 Tax=Roseococcus sp. SDR TaxID=2835532 RepID=UPI001BCF313A|nr:DUF1643 domain-containing protein [Roseococcus sp. SDR]MBS7790534.1 DUF1643 domain-containing protein [Roseococcus sp. SDR]MBV1845848.1 DUF1643 domain-containing protein [Roseococcus sp. SDR]
MTIPHDPGGKVRLRLASDIVSAAAFSECRRWRWWLERRWDGQPIGTPGFGVVIGMNPSTADLDADDPTVAGCIWRARHRWGLPGLVMLNAFAYRATDKKRLLEVDDPVGAENDATILHYARGAPLVVVAWGQPPKPLMGRGPALAALLRGAGITPMCFGTNNDGSPKHPLYQRRDAALVPFPG